MASKQPTARARKTTLRPGTSSSGRIPTTAGAASAPSAGLSAGIGSTPLMPRPPLEAALADFTRELRSALDQASADIAALRTEQTQLRAELTQLRQRYDAHTHVYQLPSFGGGGHQWIELRFLQSYIDGEHPGHKKYGIWAHGQSTPDSPPELPTSGPSA